MQQIRRCSTHARSGLTKLNMHRGCGERLLCSPPEAPLGRCKWDLIMSSTFRMRRFRKTGSIAPSCTSFGQRTRPSNAALNATSKRTAEVACESVGRCRKSGRCMEEPLTKAQRRVAALSHQACEGTLSSSTSRGIVATVGVRDGWATVEAGQVQVGMRPVRRETTSGADTEGHPES